MNDNYIYPNNLKEQAKLWFWSLKDIAIIGVAMFISILSLTQIQFYMPLALTITYTFLAIRVDDSCILDYIKHSTKYFLLTQQYYEWKEDKTE